MLSFRRKSTLPFGGKSDAASPPLPSSALVDAKEIEPHDEHEDIFSAVLSSANSKQQRASLATAAKDELTKDKFEDDEKDGKRSPPPLPFSERPPPPPPSLPSLNTPEITPDNLRALTAVPSVDRDGAVDESKEAGQQQQHARKTSSSALIAEILGTQNAASSAVSTAPAPTTVLSPPPLLSGASMTVETSQRRELPLFNMREFHGEVEQPSLAAPPPTPVAASVAPYRPPAPLTRSPPPPPYRAVHSPISVISSNPFAESASPTMSSSARLPPMVPTAALSRSPPSRPSHLFASMASQPVFSDEGVPDTPHTALPPIAATAASNPFDDDEVEGYVRSAAPISRPRVVAVAAYSASALDQLSCVAGEGLDVVDDSHGNWTMVCNVQGRKGLVPASYLRTQRKEDESLSATASVLPPVHHQASVTSHRRTASQPPMQLLGQQQRSPLAVPVPTSPVRIESPLPVPSCPSISPPSSTLRLPPPSPAPPFAPLALRLPQPSPPSQSAPPPMPRPLPTPASPVMSSAASPIASSRLLSQEPTSPSVPSTALRRPTSPAVLPTSSSFSSVPPAPPAHPANASVAESAIPTPAMEVCEAAHSYKALAADQLSLTVGEKLLLLSRHHPHWWKVVNGGGESGLVPTTYIKLLETPSSAVSSFASPPKPPPLPSHQSPLAVSVPVSAAPPLIQARSLPPPVVSPPPLPPPVLPAVPTPSQSSMPPPLTIPHPARQIQPLLATTPTSTPTAPPPPAPSAPQHRHSMSLNTISAPVKRTAPVAPLAASAPATPVAARSAVVEPPSFPLPPSSAARSSPMPPPPARPAPPAATAPAVLVSQPAVVVAAAAAAGVSQPATNVSTLVAERGEAVHSFDATDGVQLSVSRGDALFIMQRLETGWSVCRLLHTGITGLVPTSYIKSTTDRSAAG